MSNQASPGLSPHQNGDSPLSPRPRSGSISLQAAATLNAGLQRPETNQSSFPNSPSIRRESMSQSPTADRRRSQVLHNLSIADPNLPPPGEMVTSNQQALGLSGSATSPHFSPLLLASGGPPESPFARNRAPSLGELHQELENEQEFHVNRLLQEIRRLQAQVQSQQQQGGGGAGAGGQTAVANDEAASDRSTSISAASQPVLTPGSLPQSPGGIPGFHHRASHDAARAAEMRRRSRTPSRGAGSPRYRAASISGDNNDQWIGGGGRDESAFYQAETQMLTRENQMLRHRIRDLERQLAEQSRHGSTSSSHEPSHSSHLNRSTSISDEDQLASDRATRGSLGTRTDSPKEL